MLQKNIFVLLTVLLLVSSASQAQTITRLKHAAPDGIVISFQMTDGTIVGQGFNLIDWWQLTPDNTGSYVNGTWKQLASLPAGYSPLYHSSAVLPAGRVISEGGE